MLYQLTAIKAVDRNLLMKHYHNYFNYICVLAKENLFSHN